MSRRQAREVALLTLFQLEFNPSEDQEEQSRIEHISTAFDNSLSEIPKLRNQDKEFAKSLIDGVLDNIATIDSHILSVAKGRNGRNWKLNRMPAVDRNVIRLAVYELHYNSDALDYAIVINEAVDLAKKYGTDESGRYVNGVLGALKNVNI